MITNWTPFLFEALLQRTVRIRYGQPFATMPQTTPGRGKLFDEVEKSHRSHLRREPSESKRASNSPSSYKTLAIISSMILAGLDTGWPQKDGNFLWRETLRLARSSSSIQPLARAVAHNSTSYCTTQYEIGTASTQNRLIPGTLHLFEMENNETRRGRVLEGKDDWIRIQVVSVPSEMQESSLPVVIALIKKNSVRRVKPLEWEVWENVICKGERKNLEGGWRTLNILLGLPGARVGALGNALARVLMDSGTNGQLVAPRAAEELYTLIEKKSADREEQIQARAGRLRSWMLLGKHSEALDEAHVWVGEPSSPPLVAWDILGESLLREAEAAIEEHPLWQQDRFVRPRISQLLEDCMDASLIAFVREPLRMDEAARGLMRVVRVYCMQEKFPIAKQISSEVAAFYPQFQAQAEREIRNLAEKKK